MSELETGGLGAGRIEPRELEQEMRTSFLDYAMSVIVSRALPDVRDGLKPVHRRILYAMHEAGLQPGRPRLKCARVVGDVMGAYHPHGDTAIYDTLVRMAQPFSLRYPLVDGQGNFGNLDDDGAAAMRYTECRLARIATELLRDIDADTVDFVPNYDESRQQPVVLPSRFPNLLVNGSAGIAVGMATNIPPHNLSEVIDALVAMIDEPSIDVDRLSRQVKGPDFPTGGIVLGREGIKEAYRSGRGRIVMRARAHIEELRGGKTAVIVTELPYGVKKGGDAGVIKKIADLVKDKVMTEVSAVDDHSDKTGMRIQIELKRDAIPQVVLNKLWKHTSLQSTFGYNAVALVDGVPKTLPLRDLLGHYLEFQREVVTRRLKHELRQAEKRAHVLQGYLIALDSLDAVIKLIRASADTETARAGLMEQFSLSEIQAQAILDMRLARLTGLARKEVEDEYADLRERIGELRETLGDETKISAVVREELLEVKQLYGRNDDRRTEIVAAEGDLELEDLIAEEDMVIAITRSNYIKRLPVTAYREQRRGGIGVMGMELKEDDYIEHLFVASTHDYVLFFTNVGKVYRLKVHELPLGSRQSKGRAIQNLLPFRSDEQVRAVIQTRDFSEAEYLVFGTKNGVVKKTKLEAYNTPLKADGIIAIKMREGDELVGVRHASGHDDVLMVSRKGQAIRFHETNARPMGRDTAGVQGMRLRAGDEVISINIASAGSDLLVVTENGYGKRTRVEDYPGQGPRRHGGEDRSAHGRQGPARGCACRSRRLPGDADLERRHRHQDPGRGRQAARPLHPGRDRDAAARRRDGVRGSSRRRVRGGGERRRRRVSGPGRRGRAGRARGRRRRRARGRLSRRASECCCRGLRRQRVHEVAGAELHSGEHGQPRHDLDVPVARSVEPEVHGARPFDRVQAAQPLGGKLEGRLEEAALPRVALVLERRDDQLVRDATRPRRPERDAAPLGDRQLRPARLLADAAVAGPELALDLGWRLREPDELRMGVRQARSRLGALVHECVQVAVPRRGPRLPGLRDGGDLVVRQLREEVAMPRRVDDDLLALEGRIEIRHDAHLPPLVADRDPQRLGRRPLLTPCTERARLELLRRHLDRRSPKRARPLRSPGGDDDETT